MKKFLLYFIVCLIGLSACSGGQTPAGRTDASDSGLASPTVTPLSSQTPPSPSPEMSAATPSSEVSESVSQPEPSAPANILPSESIPPENRLEHLTVEDFPDQLAAPEDIAQGNKLLYLVAQLPDFDTWLYSLGGEKPGMILRVGNNWKLFDLPYATFGTKLPQLYRGDYDGDSVVELCLLISPYQDAEIDIWELHIIEFGDKNTWLDRRFDASDYQAILDESVAFSFDTDSGIVQVSAADDHLTMQIPPPAMSDGQSAGIFLSSAFGSRRVTFLVSRDKIEVDFGIELRYANTILFAEAAVHASVVYTGSVFGLSNLAIETPSAA